MFVIPCVELCRFQGSGRQEQNLANQFKAAHCMVMLIAWRSHFAYPVSLDVCDVCEAEQLKDAHAEARVPRIFGAAALRPSYEHICA